MAARMRVSTYVLRDPNAKEFGSVETQARSGSQLDAATIRAIAEGSTTPIHTTSVKYHPGAGLVYVGLSSAENDLLWSFNPRTKTWCDCGFNRISESGDHKIHQSLELDSKGLIWGGTSAWTGLHYPYTTGRGGTVFSYDPATGELISYGVPRPGDYIQNTWYDEAHHVIYGCTHPHKHFFRYDLKTRETQSWFIDSMPHRIVMDDAGRIWGTLGSDNCFFRYDPAANEVRSFAGIRPPGVSGSWEETDTQWNDIDSFINGGDGFLYFGTVGCALCRLDPRGETPEVSYLGKPISNGRLSSMQIGPDGLLYLGAGIRHSTSLVTYDRQTGAFANLGLIRDEERALTCMVCHQMTITPEGVVYIGETDQNPRSGYLWECVIAS